MNASCGKKHLNDLSGVSPSQANVQGGRAPKSIKRTHRIAERRWRLVAWIIGCRGGGTDRPYQKWQCLLYNYKAYSGLKFLLVAVCMKTHMIRLGRSSLIGCMTFNIGCPIGHQALAKNVRPGFFNRPGSLVWKSSRYFKMAVIEIPPNWYQINGTAHYQRR